MTQYLTGADLNKNLSSLALKDTPQPLAAKVTRYRTYVKGGKLCGVAMVEAPTGAKMIVATCLPIADAQEVSGWWSSVKNFGKTLGSTVAKGAKATGTGLVKVVQSPEFQSLAMQAAPMGLAALGVPPPLTQQALQLVNNARQGSQQATQKVQNINQLAQEGYAPAQQLYGIMSAYYRGGLPAVMQLPPQIPPGLNLPIPGLYRPGYMTAPPPTPYMQAPPSPYGQMTPFAPQWNQWAGNYMQLAQGQPFQIPTPGYGQGYVSGWVWNVPYRSNMSALSMDMTNPFNLVRAAYHRGAQ